MTGPRKVALGRLIGGPFHGARYTTDTRQHVLELVHVPRMPSYLDLDREPLETISAERIMYRRERLTVRDSPVEVVVWVSMDMPLEEAGALAFELLVDLALDPNGVIERAGPGDSRSVVRVPIDVSADLILDATVLADLADVAGHHARKRVLDALEHHRCALEGLEARSA